MPLALFFRSSDPWWVWLVGLVFGLLALWVGAVQGQRSAKNLQALAQRLGLDYFGNRQSGVSSSPIVSGQHEGREVSFHTFITGSGKSQQTWRAVSVKPRTTRGLSFHFRAQGLATKIKELFGAEEITVGDTAFDAAWFIQTNEPEFLRAALVPEVRAQLMAAHADADSDGYFKLESSAVVYAERGTFADANDCARYEALLPLLHDLADIAEVSAERGA